MIKDSRHVPEFIALVRYVETFTEVASGDALGAGGHQFERAKGALGDGLSSKGRQN